MNKRYLLLLPCSSLLLLLISCSSITANNPGTRTKGPVVIATDRTRYAPNDSIQVTVTNTLQTAIYAFDMQANCTILGLESQVNGKWGLASVATCSTKRLSTLVKIDAGKIYTATITAGDPGRNDAAFPVGDYRFVLKYSTSASLASDANAPVTTIYSATLTVSSDTSGVSGGTPVRNVPLSTPVGEHPNGS